MWRGTHSLLLCLFLSFLPIAWAQSTAQISGAVTDQSGAVLPGVEITATQTATGISRSGVTNETGSYVLTNLPIGPYRLEASLPGFRTFAQAGITLQVGSNPVINISLEVGQISETVEVQADAALVETRSTGVGQVIDNVRVLELPLNGRNVQELIILSGAAVGGLGTSTSRPWPTDVISVGGGLQGGLTYILDGGTHNDPFGNNNLPLPFPDALQEFKVETSALPAQYGQHSAGAVNAVTKSGTNEFHGDMFEFVRNKVLNARNTFAAQRDGLKRNQFGGVIGGPVVRNKLFFFAGHQVTLQRSEPTEKTAYVPTPQMLAGDWTTIASPLCNSGRQITLRAPFVNNRIDPVLFVTPALNMVKRNPAPIDACGKVLYGQKINSNEHISVGKIDYQLSESHSLFARYEHARLDQPNNYDGKTWFSLTEGDWKRRVHSFVIGDTYSLSPNMVSSFRGTVFRLLNEKLVKNDLFTYSDLGARGLWYPPDYPKIVIFFVSGAFDTAAGGTGGALHTPGKTNSVAFQFSEDLSWIRGAHQIGIGGNFIHTNMNYTSTTWNAGRLRFNANNTGLSMGDFMLGRVQDWQQSQPAAQYIRQNYIGLYLQDTWKATSRLTLNGGVRWEPYIWPYDARAKVAFFDKAWFDQGLKSTVFRNAPSGVLFSGDPQVGDIGYSQNSTSWLHFGPRVGLAYDPRGDGLTVIRASYGLFFDYPSLNQFTGIRDTPPRNILVSLTNPPGGWDDLWQGYPGGNPFPVTIDQNVTFPLAGAYQYFPRDTVTPQINQWNLSVQKQIGTDWLAAANYMGTNVIHNQVLQEVNPSIWQPGATTGNNQARRVLNLQNPAEGRYYSSITQVGDDFTRNYNGLSLTLQRRRARGITIQSNYTWSHCITEGAGETPDRRHLERSNCGEDRRHNFNMSTVYETPPFANSTLRALGTGWRVSGIVRVLSGAQLTVSNGLTSLGIQPNATDTRPRQILASPYAANKTIQQWLNPAAFATPALGQYGPLIQRANVTGPGSIRIDLGLTRTFRVREGQSVEFRAEAFNAPNHVNPGNPNTTLTDSAFGRILSASDPRIIQMALKYVF
jgi:hypothetical protein